MSRLLRDIKKAVAANPELRKALTPILSRHAKLLSGYDVFNKHLMPGGVEVGDVFYMELGYNPYTLNYYQVVKLTPAGVVTLRPIEKKKVKGNDREGWFVPVPGRFTGPPFAKKIKESNDRAIVWIDFRSNAAAYKWDGKAYRETNPDFVP